MEVEFGDDAQGGKVFCQRVAPGGKLAIFVDQFKRTDAGMVEVA
jgi:hypothetical protein